MMLGKIFSFCGIHTHDMRSTIFSAAEKGSYAKVDKRVSPYDYGHAEMKNRVKLTVPDLTGALDMGMTDHCTEDITIDGRKLIVNWDNHRSGGRGMMCFNAISYVSNGSRMKNNEMLAEFTGSEVREALHTRNSNDRLKFAAALNYAIEKDSSPIWTDYLSIADTYKEDTAKRMKLIGKAYAMSEGTMIILEKRDADIVSLFIENLSDLYVTIESCSEVCQIKAKVEKLLKCMDDRGLYSYWSRAWTMQELHLSNEAEYFLLYEEKLYCHEKYQGHGIYGKSPDNENKQYKKTASIRAIVKSSELRDASIITYCLLQDTIDRAKNKHVQIDDLEDLENMSKEAMWQICRLLTGDQRLEVAHVVTPLDHKSRDSCIMYDMCSNVRCAGSEGDMTHAVAIALGIYGSEYGDLLSAIDAKFVDEGFLPFVHYCSIQGVNTTWRPRGMKLAFHTKEQPHVSTRYLAYNRRTLGTRFYACVGVDNWLVIKGTEFKIKIIDIKPDLVKTTERKCGNFYIDRQQSIKLYEATVQLDGTVPIEKDLDQKSGLTRLTSDVEDYMKHIKAEITCEEDLIPMQKINVLHSGEYMMILHRNFMTSVGTLRVVDMKDRKMLENYDKSSTDKSRMYAMMVDKEKWVSTD